MTALIRYLDSYRRRDLGEASIDPDWLRDHHIKPHLPPGQVAIDEQRFAADLVESDREIYRGS